MSSSLQHDDSGVPPISGTFEPGGAPVVDYEQRLAADWSYSMSEGDRFFQDTSGPHQALQRIAKRLNELQIPYAVAGGMALYRHGFRRFTEDVDILVTQEGLARIHDELDGRGCLPPFSRSKNPRDTDSGVKIEFLVAGQFPGDGKPKPVAFPDPATVAIEFDQIKFVNLPTLVNLKLASGMTNSGRLKDLGDVQELIKWLNLPADFANELHPYVQSEYSKLWQGVEQNRETLDN